MSGNFYLRKLRGAFFSAYEVLFTLFVIVYTKVTRKKTVTRNSNKLRVLQYSEAYGVGGVLKVIERLSLGLSESSRPPIKQVLILIDKQEIKKYFEKVTKNNLSVIKTRYIDLPSGYFSFKEFYHLKSLIKEDNFNIAHIHLYAPDSCRTAILAASMAGVPVITTEHLYSEVTTFRRYVLKWLSQVLINRIIAVSESVKVNLVRNRGVRPSKIETIPNSIDLNLFCKDSSKKNNSTNIRCSHIFDDNTVLIGTVAAFFARKGHEYLLGAASKIIDKHPNTKFIFIGEGSLILEMKKRAQELGLSKNVEFLGFIENVLPYYSIFDIFVLPSLGEGMPLTLLEAMAMGVPVVATAVDGSKELVLDGETGLLVPSQNVMALAKAIEYMIENPEKAKEMGNAGRKRIRNKYSLQRNIEETINIYLKN